MQKLELFGFQAGIDRDSHRLIPLAEDVEYELTGRKCAGEMLPLLADESYRAADEPFYDFYRALCRREDGPRFSERNLRYDCTVVMPGTAGGEYRKTAGHFHCKAPDSGVGYPELYQVVQGTAVFVMQRVDDEEKTDGKMRVLDCVLAEVSAGEAVVIPPGYGHCTVNVGAEALVFVNLVSVDSLNAYGGIQAARGLCCYLMEQAGGGWRAERNPRYAFDCVPRTVRPVENEALGVRLNRPCYTEFLRAQQDYDYLDRPSLRKESDFLNPLRENGEGVHAP